MKENKPGRDAAVVAADELIARKVCLLINLRIRIISRIKNVIKGGKL